MTDRMRAIPTKIESMRLAIQFIPVPYQKRGALEKGCSEIGII